MSDSVVVEAAKMLREMEQQARETVVAAYKTEGADLRGCAIVFRPTPDGIEALVRFELNGNVHDLKVDGPRADRRRMLDSDAGSHVEWFLTAWHDALAKAITREVMRGFENSIVKVVSRI